MKNKNATYHFDEKSVNDKKRQLIEQRQFECFPDLQSQKNSLSST